MARLIVKNIGPIKDIDIDLKKVNVFMGPQGCGKSTLAKIISFCSWLEKDNDASFNAENVGLIKTLTAYHRMEGYFNEDSKLAYMGDDVNVFYNYNTEEPLPYFGNINDYNACHIHKKEAVYRKIEKGTNPKVIYIPAERNFVSVVPNLKKYSEKDDALQNFVNEWFVAKRTYTEKNPLKIEMLGIAYYYSEKSDSDMLIVDGNPIRLNQSCSGFQSIVPLMALLSYMSSAIYEENKPFSPEESRQMKEILAHVSNDKTGEMEQKVIERIKAFLQGKVYTYTQFVIEEPEQNLFPDTQCELLYFLLSCLNHGKAHRAIITTHSPYILYALNNCILANIVRDDVPEEEKGIQDMRSAYVNIAPNDVAVWEIENGVMKTVGNANNNTIQDNDGLIRKNYFNSVMQHVIKDFNNLLMYKN